MKLYDYAVIEKPVIALSFMFLITILLSIGLKDFKLDASADSLTLERDADLEFHRQVSTRYGTDNFLVVTFKPNTGSLFDDANLDTIKIMSEKLSKVDGVLDVSSIVNVPLLYSPKITIEDLADEPRTLLSKGIDKDLAITEFLESPIYRDNILSENIEITAILLTIAIDKKYMALAENRDNLRQRSNEVGLTTEETKQLDIANTKFNDYQTIRYELDHERVRQVRLILDQYSDRGTIFLGGPDMITADLISFIKKDLVIYGIGIVIFILIILSLIFKEPEFVILPLISCTSCVLIVLGSLSWLGWKLTIISSNFILLLIILTLAINVHLIVRFRELSNIGNKLQTKSNVQLVVKTMLKPCFYTMLTTIVAFLSLVTSNIRPVIDFGIMMTIGVSCAFLTVFVVIPATLCLFCDKRFKTRKDLSLNITHKLAMVTEKYGTQIIAISLGLCAFGIIGISQLKVENKFIDFFHSSTEIHQGMKTVDQSLGGTTPLDVIINAPEFSMNTEDLPVDFGAGEETGFSEYENSLDFDEFVEFDDFSDYGMDEDNLGNLEPSYWFSSVGLSELEKLHNYMENLPEIGKVTSLVQLNKIGTDLSNRKLNDLELSLLRQNLDKEVTKQLVTPFWHEETDEVRIQARIVEGSENLNRKALISKIENYAYKELNLEKDQVRLSGIFVLYENMLNSLYKSQIQTLTSVLLAIFAMFMLLFKSIKLSLIAITPNILAAIVILGSMGILNIPLNMMTITIAAITVGIGVDHAIHYISRFKVEFKKHQKYTVALRNAHTSIGQALFIASVTIIAGFSILTFSNFVPSIHFGILTGMAMTLALVGSLTLMPKLILLTKPFKVTKN